MTYTASAVAAKKWKESGKRDDRIWDRKMPKISLSL
jgi:hypothetical protein